MLTEEHEKKNIAHCLTFLERYHKDGIKCLNHVVTGDDIGSVTIHQRPNNSPLSGIIPDHFRNHEYPSRLSTWKIVATVFWDRKGILLVDFLSQGMTTRQVYCEMLSFGRPIETTAMDCLQVTSAPFMTMLGHTLRQGQQRCWASLDVKNLIIHLIVLNPTYSTFGLPSFPKLKVFFFWGGGSIWLMMMNWNRLSLHTVEQIGGRFLCWWYK